MNKVKAEKKKKNNLFIGEIRKKRASKKFRPYKQVMQEAMSDVREMIGK